MPGADTYQVIAYTSDLCGTSPVGKNGLLTSTYAKGVHIAFALKMLEDLPRTFTFSKEEDDGDADGAEPDIDTGMVPINERYRARVLITKDLLLDCINHARNAGFTVVGILCEDPDADDILRDLTEEYGSDSIFGKLLRETPILGVPVLNHNASEDWVIPNHILVLAKSEE